MDKTSNIKNVVLVSIDNLRKDSLGCYGSPFSTPTIDKLASNGIRFESCITTSNTTTPSHASMLTGTYPFKHQARVNGSDIDNTEIA